MTVKNIQQEIDEDVLLSAAKNTLDDSVRNLDAETLDRLATIRLNAVAHSANRKSKSWRSNNWFVPAGGFVTAAVLVVAVMLWSSTPVVNDPASMAVLEDISILTDSESLEFYQDLEFYQWLAINEQTVG